MQHTNKMIFKIHCLVRLDDDGIILLKYIERVDSIVYFNENIYKFKHKLQLKIYKTSSVQLKITKASPYIDLRNYLLL